MMEMDESPAAHQNMLSEKYSDLILRSDGLDFKVHKAIVCSKSPVIANACDKYKGKGTQIIDIELFESAIVKQMIVFMYTNKYDPEGGENYHVPFETASSEAIDEVSMDCSGEESPEEDGDETLSQSSNWEHLEENPMEEDAGSSSSSSGSKIGTTHILTFRPRREGSLASIIDQVATVQVGGTISPDPALSAPDRVVTTSNVGPTCCSGWSSTRHAGSAIQGVDRQIRGLEYGDLVHTMTVNIQMNAIANYFDISALAKESRMAIQHLLRNYWSPEDFPFFVQVVFESTTDQALQNMLVEFAVGHFDELVNQIDDFTRPGVMRSFYYNVISTINAKTKSTAEEVDQLTNQIRLIEDERWEEKWQGNRAREHSQALEQSLKRISNVLNQNQQCRNGNCGAAMPYTLEECVSESGAPTYKLRCSQCQSIHG